MGIPAFAYSLQHSIDLKLLQPLCPTGYLKIITKRNSFISCGHMHPLLAANLVESSDISFMGLGVLDYCPWSNLSFDAKWCIMRQ